MESKPDVNLVIESIIIGNMPAESSILAVGYITISKTWNIMAIKNNC